MAVTGTITTYGLTEGIYLDFEPMIHQLSPFDVPLQGLNTAEGRTVLSSDTCFEKKVEWHDEALLTPRSTLAATVTTGGTVLTVASGEQANFSTGDLLLVNAEYILVTDYGVTADTLLTTRAISGSADTLASGEVVMSVGSYLAEGSDPEDARAVDRTNRYNYTQIFGPHAVQVSGTELAIKKYGLEGTNEFQHQGGQRIKEMAIAFEQALLYGVRTEDSNAKKRSMGGFLYYITTNVDSSTTSLTETKLLDIMQTSFGYGGNVNVLVSGAKQKRVISAFTSSGVIEVMRADGTAGRKVDVYESDFGVVACTLNRWCRLEDLFGFNRDQATVCTLRPLGMEMLAKTGDSIKGQALMEKTLKFRRERHAFRFSALT